MSSFWVKTVESSTLYELRTDIFFSKKEGHNLPPLFPTNHATDGTDLSSAHPPLQPLQSPFSATECLIVIKLGAKCCLYLLDLNWYS